MKSPILGALVFAGLFMPTFFVSAASLYMDPGKTEINRGDVITVGLRLDTDEGECVNVVDATIKYTENIVPVDTSRGGSILSVWLEDPVIDKANRTITFAGGIPNGYCGRIIGDPRLTNTVLEIVFSSPGLQIGTTESGNLAKITYEDSTRVLLNDGFGHDAPLTTFGSEITLSKKAGGQMVNEWNELVSSDNIPPEEFSITLERSDNAFDNRYFIVFNTTDKQSGVDYYEVIEESFAESKLFQWGAITAPWVKAQSPYVLKDQTLNSTIRVRAFDKAGNEYIATLVPDESLRTFNVQAKLMVTAFITLLLLLVLGGLGYWWYRRRQSKYVYEEEIDDDGEEEEEDYEEDYEDVSESKND